MGLRVNLRGAHTIAVAVIAIGLIVFSGDESSTSPAPGSRTMAERPLVPLATDGDETLAVEPEPEIDPVCTFGFLELYVEEGHVEVPGLTGDEPLIGPSLHSVSFTDGLMLLHRRYRESRDTISKSVPLFDSFAAPRRYVLFALHYNANNNFFEFDEMIRALNAYPLDWDRVADEFLDSERGREELVARSKREAEMLRSGQWRHQCLIPKLAQRYPNFTKRSRVEQNVLAIAQLWLTELGSQNGIGGFPRMRRYLDLHEVELGEETDVAGVESATIDIPGAAWELTNFDRWNNLKPHVGYLSEVMRTGDWLWYHDSYQPLHR